MAWTAGGAQGEGGGHEAGQRKSAPPVDKTGRGAKDNKPFLGYQKEREKASGDDGTGDYRLLQRGKG